MSKMLLNITVNLLFAFSFSIKPGQTMKQEDFEGFSRLHARGITGKGTKVCVVESQDACYRNHPAFEGVRDQIEFISVGRASNVPEGFEDRSRRRYPADNEIEPELLEGIQDQNGPHGTHVAALIISHPQQHTQEFLEFPGGVAPDARMSFIEISGVCLKDCWQDAESRNYGTALYSFKDVDLKPELDLDAQENFDFESNQYRRGSKYEGGFTPETYLKFYRSTRNFFFSFLRLSPYYNEKIDDSLVDAFDQAFKSGAKVLNFSMILASITDPLSDYRIPEPLLQKITQGLVANDQILVMAANNQGRNLSEYKNQVYFKQFSENADISSRMLIVMNVYIGKKGKKIKRFYTSNWPGKDLSNYTVSAFGKDVVSGYSLKGSEVFRAVSGTSQAAPKVAGFCLLVEQFFKDSSQEITSCGIVDFVKRTARPLGDPEIFGKGLINPDALLNEVRLFSSP